MTRKCRDVCVALSGSSPVVKVFTASTAPGGMSLQLPQLMAVPPSILFYMQIRPNHLGVFFKSGAAQHGDRRGITVKAIRFQFHLTDGEWDPTSRP